MGPRQPRTAAATLAVAGSIRSFLPPGGGSAPRRLFLCASHIINHGTAGFGGVAGGFGAWAWLMVVGQRDWQRRADNSAGLAWRTSWACDAVLDRLAGKRRDHKRTWAVT